MPSFRTLRPASRTLVSDTPRYVHYDFVLKRLGRLCCATTRGSNNEISQLGWAYQRMRTPHDCSRSKNQRIGMSLGCRAFAETRFQTGESTAATNRSFGSSGANCRRPRFDRLDAPAFTLCTAAKAPSVRQLADVDLTSKGDYYMAGRGSSIGTFGAGFRSEALSTMLENRLHLRVEMGIETAGNYLTLKA